MKHIKLLAVILSVLLAIFIVLLTFGSFFAYQAKNLIIKKIEADINKQLTIEKINYIPTKGLVLINVYIHEKNTAKETGILIGKLHLKVNIPILFASKKLILTLRVEDLKKGSVSGSGSIIIEYGKSKSKQKPLQSISPCVFHISNFDLSGSFFRFKNISGPVYSRKDQIVSKSITFNYQDNPHSLSFIIKSPGKNQSAIIRVAGPNINTNINLNNQDYGIKIDLSKIQFYDSFYEFEGLLKTSGQKDFFIKGSLNISPSDLRHLNKILRDACDLLKPEGAILGKVEICGNADEMEKTSFTATLTSLKLKLYNFYASNLYSEIGYENGALTIPILKFESYKGTVNLAFKADIFNESLPMAAHVTLKNLDLNSIIQDSPIKNKDILGTVYIESILNGNLNDHNSITGTGIISISDANLGPMPILSPLVGNLYGFIRSMVPDLKNIEIQGGTCDFFVKERKILSDNIVLTGDILNIYAKGYMDFDKNLNFKVENKFNEIPKGAGDWREGFLKTLTTFGQFIGNAYLTGTLENPKWKFEYFSEKGSLENKIVGVLKGFLK